MNKTIQEMESLIEKIRKADDAYYGDDDPIMADREYDQLFDALVGLEKESGIILTYSPTQKVSGVVLDKLEKVRFGEKILSAKKAKTIEELSAFMNGRKLCATYKLDGLTIVLRYEDGRFRQAITRGDGDVGEDVTEAFRFVRGVPMTIPLKTKISLRGECLIGWDSYREIEKRYGEEGKPCGHPRNLASGSIRQLNTSLVEERKLEFFAFSIIENETELPAGARRAFEAKSAQLSLLSKLGFHSVQELGGCLIETGQQLRGAMDILVAQKCPYPVDGVIYEYNDLGYGKSLGATGHHTNNMVAFKWKDDLYKATFRSIEFMPTRLGIVSMTACFDSVLMDCSNVSRALIPNLEYFYGLKLGEGDQIEVCLANSIIPQIKSNLTASGTYELPKYCPVCRTGLEIVNLAGTRNLCCPNAICPERVAQRFVHFAEKDRFDIEGLSTSAIRVFVEKGMLKTLADVFRLENHEAEIKALPGFGEKSYRKLIDAINEKRAVKLETLIAALGLENVGRTAGRMISEHCLHDFDNFVIAMDRGFDFSKLDGIGPTIQESLTNWWRQPETWPMLDELVSELTFESPGELPEGETDLIFEGKSIVVTGTLSRYKRKEIKILIEKLGGRPAESVSKNTSFVIVGKNPGAKLDNANKLGIRVVSESEFAAMIENG